MTRNLTAKTPQRYLGSRSPAFRRSTGRRNLPFSGGVLGVKGRPLAISINNAPSPSAKPVLILNRAALGNCTDGPRKATAAGVQQATKKEPGD